MSNRKLRERKFRREAEAVQMGVEAAAKASGLSSVSAANAFTAASPAQKAAAVQGSAAVKQAAQINTTNLSTNATYVPSTGNSLGGNTANTGLGSVIVSQAPAAVPAAQQLQPAPVKPPPTVVAQPAQVQTPAPTPQYSATVPLPAPVNAPTVLPATSGNGPGTVYTAPTAAEPERAYIPPSGGSSDTDWESVSAPQAAPNALTIPPKGKDVFTPPKAAAIITPLAGPKPSLFARFMMWLGFSKTPPPATVHGEAMTRMDAAGSVVRRARSGDQNAMAIIDMTRRNAADGDIQAQLGYTAIETYIKSHPVDGLSTMAGEDDCDVYRVAVKLAEGPPLTDQKIRLGTARYSPPEFKAFRHGYYHPDVIPLDDGIHPVILAAINSGRIVSMARRLQKVRCGALTLKAYDVNIGWELEGE